MSRSRPIPSNRAVIDRSLLAPWVSWVSWVYPTRFKNGFTLSDVRLRSEQHVSFSERLKRTHETHETHETHRSGGQVSGIGVGRGFAVFVSRQGGRRA